VFVFATLFLNAREAIAASSNSTNSSTTRSIIFGAIESIDIPYDGIADEVNILSKSFKNSLSEKLLRHSSDLAVNSQGRIVTTTTGSSNGSKDKNQRVIETKSGQSSIQIAVAIVETMGPLNKETICNNDMDIEEIAGQFATSLHNKWGIGEDITLVDKEDRTEIKSGGGTGVLVFLSILDRVVFISVGGALDRVLTNGRIDRIIKNTMRTELQKANYELGLTKGIDAIVETLKDGEKPSLFEKVQEKGFSTNNISILIWVIFVIGNGVVKRLQRQRERLYAKAATQLSKLDESCAEARRGSFQPTTSCSICLQDFLSTNVGSDGHPVQLLRCGHVFDKTCYQKWISSGCGDITRCPVCRLDVGLSSNDLSASLTDRNVDIHTFNAISVSDGDGDPNDSNSININSPHGAVSNTDDITFKFEDSIADDNISIAERSFDSTSHAMTPYQTDRVFRLERLSELYPSYITTDIMERWRSSTFNGSLEWDLSFRNKDPSILRNNSCCPSSIDDSEHSIHRDSYQRVDCNFGGGTSAGGKGGRF